MNIKKGMIYVLIANVVNLIISLFTGFLLPKYLSIDTYAYIKLFQLYITYIGITHLGYSDGMYLKLGGKKLENIDKKEVLEEFKTFKFFQFAVSIIAISVSLLIQNEMLFFCSIAILPINISNYIRQLYNAIGQFKKYSRYTNINTIFIFIINLVLLFIIKSDYYYTYIIAQLIAYFLYWCFIEYEIKKMFGKQSIRINKKYIFENIKSGFLLLIGNFCNVIFTSIDRIFVKNLIGLVQFAYYSFAMSIENLINVFITPISTVMYNYFCNKRDLNSVLKVKKYILVFSSILIIIVFPAKFIIEHWIIKYVESIPILFLLVSAQYISIMIRAVHMNLYKAEKKQKRYFKIMILIVVLSFLLNVIAYSIEKSMVSIAIATLVANIIWFVVGEIDFKKYKMKFFDYVYFFTILFLFLACGLFLDAIIGIIVYLIFLVIMLFLFQKNCFIDIFFICRNMLKSKIKNK